MFSLYQRGWGGCGTITTTGRFELLVYVPSACQPRRYQFLLFLSATEACYCPERRPLNGSCPQLMVTAYIYLCVFTKAYERISSAFTAATPRGTAATLCSLRLVQLLKLNLTRPRVLKCRLLNTTSSLAGWWSCRGAHLAGENLRRASRVSRQDPEGRYRVCDLGNYAEISSKKKKKKKYVYPQTNERVLLQHPSIY